MRLFGRKSEPDQASRIASFWAWWDEARPKVDELVNAGSAGELAELVGPAVAALDPSLVWEVAPGQLATHALVVSAAGDPELRSFTHRWALAAPAADGRWEFHPSRPANPKALELTMEVGGHRFGVDGLMLGVRIPPGTPRVNVSAYHPIFQDVDDETRMEATLLALDWLLGEDEVARWIGDIVAAEFEPIDAIAATYLPGVVEDHAKSFPTGRWMLMEGRSGAGEPLTAAARYPLRPVDFPLFDQHIAIALPYRERDEKGGPAGESLSAFQAFEERLTAHLAQHPAAVLVAQLSAESVRTYHLYADPSADAAPALKELAAGWPEGRVRVEGNSDPSWSAVAPFLS